MELDDDELLTREQRNKIKRRLRMVDARKKGMHTPEEWQTLVAVCGTKCAKCGREGYHLDKDHILPVYQGGSDGLDNIQPLCAWCNAKKGPDGTDHRPENWRSEVDRLLSRETP